MATDKREMRETAVQDETESYCPWRKKTSTTETDQLINI